MIDRDRAAKEKAPNETLNDTNTTNEMSSVALNRIMDHNYSGFLFIFLYNQKISSSAAGSLFQLYPAVAKWRHLIFLHVVTMVQS